MQAGIKLIQMLNVKSGLFLPKLEIYCNIGRKYIKWPKYLPLFGKPKNSLTGGNVKFVVFPRGKEKKKMLMRVSEVCVSAVYDLPSMYFISFSLGTTNYCRWKKKTIILFVIKLRQIYIQFLFDNNASFRKLNFLFILLRHTTAKL